MTGSLPTELGILTSLVILDLSYNILLSGSLPFELCGLSNLRRLEVGFTSLTGNLPACFALALPELVELVAPNASLSGPFPDLCEMTKLQWIDIRHNKFTGNLPKCVWPDAKVLYLSDNLFEVRCHCGWYSRWIRPIFCVCLSLIFYPTGNPTDATGQHGQSDGPLCRRQQAIR
jgi:hypothetical protein